MLYRDDTLLIMSGCEDAARCTPSGKQTRSFLREDRRSRAQAQQRHFALRFKPFAEEINSNCTGRGVNWNSKLGQPPQRAFSLPPRREAPEEAAPAARAQRRRLTTVSGRSAHSCMFTGKGGQAPADRACQVPMRVVSTCGHVVRHRPRPNRPRPAPSTPIVSSYSPPGAFAVSMIRFCLVCFASSSFSVSYFAEISQSKSQTSCH
uniref:Uncharacterized protein n=1 Tax=Myotis myotis TaxID=51298 RepID=A0A7J7WHL9_MYOMY|nr:hypothetical protein mMyoMyo1_012040 [Myotis myotis]